MQELKGHTRTVQSIAFARHAHLFATGGDDRSIRLWDARSGEPRGVMKGPPGGVSHLAITEDGRYLCSVGSD
jgi:WD40 repeat protein